MADPTAHAVKRRSVYTLLLFFLLRPLLFAGFQVTLALFLLFRVDDGAWQDAQGYWMLTGLLTNLVILHILLKRNRRTTTVKDVQVIHFNWKKDLLFALILLALAIPVSSLPNVLLSQWLWQSPETAENLFFRHLPGWAVIMVIPWAAMQGLTELPYYFSFLTGELSRRFARTQAFALSSCALAFQHVALPLILDWRFIAWRFGMFL